MTPNLSSPPLTKEQRDSFIAVIERWQDFNGYSDCHAARMLEIPVIRLLQWMNGTLVPTQEEVGRVLAAIAPSDCENTSLSAERSDY